MEEILELKSKLIEGDISGALAIVAELEDMSKNDIINNIISYAVVLLIHLIKQQVENRNTRSWEVSIRNSVLKIQSLNKRRKYGTGIGVEVGHGSVQAFGLDRGHGIAVLKNLWMVR